MASEEQIPPAVANTQERPHEQRRCVEEEENVVYLDDEGNIIPPESEASCLMAMALGPLPDDDTGASSEWFGGETPALVLDGEGMQEFASNLLLLEDEEEEEIEEASPTTPGSAEQQDEDDEGMVGARTFSDVGEDEEWVLERIVKRRLNKETKEHEYLCKWKWYAEHTWEEKEWLLDQGHGKEVQAVDDAKGPAKPKTIRSEKQIPSLSKLLLQHLPNLVQDVCAKYRECYRRVVRFAECPPCGATKRFMETWAKEPNSKPVILFHGTRFKNFPSIMTRGFIVPDAGMKVANGSVYGVGIYTATNPDFPSYFSSDSDKIFVCLGLLNDKVGCHHDIRVFSEENRVVPLWVVEDAYENDDDEEEKQPVCVSVDSLLSRRYGSQTPHWDRRNDSPRYACGEVPKRMLDRGGGMSKKMLKQQPRWIKDLYKGGGVPQKKRN